MQLLAKIKKLSGVFAWVFLVSSASFAAPGDVVFVAGSTKKINQLTGDFDRQQNKPTLSETNKRFGVLGTDLGSSFEHKGKLFFLFGDTWGAQGLPDAIAWTTSLDPSQIVLDFHAKNGRWQPPIVPGVRLEGFEIPSGGVSVGGKMFVVFTTDWQPEKGNMGRSVLAVSQDNGQNFRVLFELSREKFINVSLCQSGEWLYIFGSGVYRKSSVFLARVGAKNIENKAQIQYLSGFDQKGKAQWSGNESAAQKLFNHDVVGEFSVAWCAPLKRFLMLYNSGEPRGIVMRSAKNPWGPWSDLTTIFDPWRDGGYGHFMHISSNFKNENAPHDQVSDPNRETEWGGEYGPYLMARYFRRIPNGCRIYFTMSTWNPYQVVVMQSDLKNAP